MRGTLFIVAACFFWSTPGSAATAPKGVRLHLAGCGAYLVGALPGQYSPDRAPPKDERGQTMDQTILRYLQLHPPETLEGEILATLLLKLRALTPRSLGVAGALNRFNLSTPEGAPLWDAPAVERALSAECDRLVNAHAQTGADFSRREDLTALYRSLRDRGAPNDWIADAFNTMGVNGGNWSPEFVAKKWAEPPPATEAIFARWAAVRGAAAATNDEATAAPFVAELRKALGRPKWVVAEILREGVPPVAGGVWDEATVEALYRLDLGGPTVREQKRNGNSTGRAEALIVAALDKGIVTADERSKLVRLLANIPLSAEAVASLLRGRIRTLEGHSNWTAADVAFERSTDRKQRSDVIRTASTTSLEHVDQLVAAMTDEGFGPKDIAEILNAVPVAGGGWTRHNLRSRRNGAEVPVLAPLVVERLILKTRAEQDRILLIQATNQRPDMAALTLNRRGMSAPPGHDRWTGELVRKAKEDAIHRVYLDRKPQNFALRDTVDAFLADLDALDFSYAEMARGLNEHNVPAVNGAKWGYNAIKDRVQALRRGEALAANRPPRYPWRKPPKDWVAAEYVQALAAQSDLTRERALEAFFELRWHGLSIDAIVALFNSLGVRKPFGDTTWNTGALTRPAMQRQQQIEHAVREVKPRNEADVLLAIRQLDAVLYDPSRIAALLTAAGVMRGNDLWTAVDVGHVLAKRSGGDGTQQGNYFYHPSFQNDEQMQKDLARVRSLVAEKEAERPMTWFPNGEKNEVLRVYNYLKWIASTAPEEQQRARRAEILRIRNVLWQSNMTLVHAGVRSFSNLPNKLTYDDWVSEGSFGLLDAIDGFDFRLGFEFTTLATRAIFNTINGKVIQLKRRQTGITATDLTGPSEDSGNLVETAPDTAPAAPDVVEDEEEKDRLERALRRLDAVDAEIIRYRFGVGIDEETMTRDDLAARLSIAPAEVLRRELKARAQLKKILVAFDDD